MSATDEHDLIQHWLAGELGKRRGAVGSAQLSWWDGYSSKRVRGAEALAEVFAQQTGLEWELPNVDEGKLQPEVIWEFAIPGRSGPVGYIDLLLLVPVLSIGLHHDGLADCSRNGACGDRTHWEYSESAGMVATAVEVKSHIKSLGELLRQVNGYRSALPWCNCPYRYGQQIHDRGVRHFGVDTPIGFAVASPDDRFVPEIYGQEIDFIHTPWAKPTVQKR